MLFELFPGIALAAAFLLSFLLVWGVPIYFIYREKYVPEQEKKLWIIASVFFPWVAFLAFVLVAPVTSLRQN